MGKVDFILQEKKGEGGSLTLFILIPQSHVFCLFVRIRDPNTILDFVCSHSIFNLIFLRTLNIFIPMFSLGLRVFPFVP